MNGVYVPPTEVIEKYADVLVNFALNGGEGIKPGEVVECAVPDIAKPLALALQNAILKSGGHPMVRLLPTGFDKNFFELANQDQLKFFPKKYLKSKIDLLDHQIGIIADVDPYDLKDINPKKIITARDAKKAYREWFVEKETQGKFTWTLALWGVQAKADIVGLSLEEYWQQIIQACFLDEADPIAHWKKLNKDQNDIKKALNSMEIEYVEMKGPDVDLKIKLGPERMWQGGSGRNIPSFEFFTSPDWRGTEGWIKFNQPVYRYGQVLQGVYLEFKDGIVAKATAEKGQELLDQMLQTENANKIGEFSLTDKRMSRITHTMAETLFDENIGGPFGNTHLAIGMAYKDCYRGDAEKLSKDEWAQLGYNESAEHTDIVSTTDRTVTAILTNGDRQVLYQDGQFTCYTG
jgi:aminopeptidase